MNSLQRISSLEQAQLMAHNKELIGVFEVPKEIYHKGPGISCSGLKDVDESPFHYQWRQSNPMEWSRAMRLGDALHAYILEVKNFEHDVIVAGKNGNTKAHREAKKEFPDKNVITEDDFEVVQGAALAIRSSVLSRKLLSGYHEYAFYWIDEATGELCKCRPDSLHKTGGIIGDLKFTGQIDEEDFMRNCVQLKYNMQNAFYLDGVNLAIEQSGQRIPGFKAPERFFFVAVAQKAPYEILHCDLPPEFVDDGRKRYKKALKAYARAKTEGYWPKKNEIYNEDRGEWVESVKRLRPQPWAYTKEEE